MCLSQAATNRELLLHAQTSSPCRPLPPQSCRADLAPAFLDGLQQYSHCWVLYVFHMNTDLQRLWVAAPDGRGRAGFKGKIRVPRLDGSKLGVFATRSPHRQGPRIHPLWVECSWPLLPPRPSSNHSLQRPLHCISACGWPVTGWAAQHRNAQHQLQRPTLLQAVPHRAQRGAGAGGGGAHGGAGRRRHCGRQPGAGPQALRPLLRCGAGRKGPRMGAFLAFCKS